MNTTEGLPFEPPCTPRRRTPRTAATCPWRSLMLSLAAAVALAACGQRGPLYLPAPEPAAGENPAADTADEESEETRDETTPGA